MAPHPHGPDNAAACCGCDRVHDAWEQIAASLLEEA